MSVLDGVGGGVRCVYATDPEGGLTDRLREVLVDLPAWRASAVGLDDWIRRFDWRTVVSDYDERLEGLATAGPSRGAN